MVKVGDVEYSKLKGSYQETFDGIAYKTKGKGYTKDQLEVDSKTGKIVKKTVIQVGPYKQKILEDEPWSEYSKKFGSREMVWNGIAYQTRSKLKKTDLVLNSKGKIVSKKKSLLAKERFKHRKNILKLSKEVEKVEKEEIIEEKEVKEEVKEVKEVKEVEKEEKEESEESSDEPVKKYNDIEYKHEYKSEYDETDEYDTYHNTRKYERFYDASFESLW